MIEIKNITKKYGDFTAIEDISFNVEKSSIYGLVGYNGAGKTTLLKTASGIFKPESGEVLFDGENIYNNGEVRSKLIYVPDEVYFLKVQALKEWQSFIKAIIRILTIKFLKI
jgi:ABC-2 type transport system ATP-binding protein